MQKRNHIIQRKRAEILKAGGKVEVNMKIGMPILGVITTGAEEAEVAETIRRITPTRIEMTINLLANVSITII